MTIYWSLKQIPELSGRPRRERRLAFKRLCGQTRGAPVNLWTATAWLGLIFIIWGSAFASSFLSDVPGACVLAVGAMGAFYLHFFLYLNYLGYCLRVGQFKIL